MLNVLIQSYIQNLITEVRDVKDNQQSNYLIQFDKLSGIGIVLQIFLCSYANSYLGSKLTTVDPDWETVWNWYAAHLDNRQPRWWERWQRWPRRWLWWLFQSWPRWWWYCQGTPIEHAGWLVRTARSRTGSLISCWLYWCLSLLWCFWCQFSGRYQHLYTGFLIYFHLSLSP